MKKILSLFILTILVFSFVGCGGSANSAKETEPKINVQKKEAVEGDTDVNLKGTNSEKAEKEEEAIVEDTAENEKSKDLKPILASAPMPAKSSISEELDDAVANAVITSNSGSYMDGECNAEGHIILDSSENSSYITLYALTTYGEYAFQNDMFIKISGTGVIPVAMTFLEDKDDGYILQSYKLPEDGEGYAASIKTLFPQELYNRVVHPSDGDRAALQAQERKYAEQYLDSIGRTAVIGEYSDLEIEYPDISSENLDLIFNRYWEYPRWIGTEEKIENGVRYVYETQWKNYGNNDSMVYLTKYVYDTGEIIRTINVHIDDGEVQATEEKVLRLIENSKHE